MTPAVWILHASTQYQTRTNRTRKSRFAYRHWKWRFVQKTLDLTAYSSI